jgi:hypothetical protein
MKSSKLIPMAALALALSASSVLQADPQEHGRRYDDRYDDRYNDRYDDRYDGRSGGRYDSRRVAALAHEIEQTAYSIRREAERNNRRPNRWEARMLSSLRELNQEASQFHAQVEGRRYDGRSGRDFEDLVQAYRETGYIVSRNDPRPYLDRGLERIGYLLSEISGQYGGRRDDYRWDRNDRRYGRDWNDRDWDRWDRDHR